jgi:hypothetical protein
MFSRTQCPYRPEAFTSWVKWPESDADNSPSVAEVKNGGTVPHFPVRFCALERN